MLNASKKAWADKRPSIPAIIFSLTIFLALTFAPHSDFISSSAYAIAAGADKAAFDASPEKSQQMKYQLYIGGINAVEATLDLEQTTKEDRYRLFMDAQTRGFLGKLVPWNGSFETYGWALEDRDQPEKHESISVWRKEVEIKTYSYNKDGTFNNYKITEDGVDKTHKQPIEDLVQGTIDAMTASLQAMRAVGLDESCEGTSEVFDGKRRFKLKFRHDEDETLKKTDYNVYSGVTARCVVEVVPMEGAWHKKPRGWLSIQEQGRKKGTLPTIWLAKMDPDKPAIPVKMRIKTDYGTLFMHMVEYKSGDNVISAKSN